MSATPEISVIAIISVIAVLFLLGLGLCGLLLAMSRHHRRLGLKMLAFGFLLVVGVAVFIATMTFKSEQVVYQETHPAEVQTVDPRPDMAVGMALLPLLLLIVVGLAALATLVFSRRHRGLAAGVVALLAILLVPVVGYWTLSRSYSRAHRQAVLVSHEMNDRLLKDAVNQRLMDDRQLIALDPSEATELTAEALDETEAAELAALTNPTPSNAESTPDAQSNTQTAKIDPPQRPEWINAPPAMDGSEEVIESDPFQSRMECKSDLDRRIRAAIQSYARIYCRENGGPESATFPATNLEVSLVSKGKRHDELIHTRYGPMRKIYQQVVYGDDLREHLDRRISEAIIAQRLTRTGVTSGGVLLMLASLYGYLNLAQKRSTRRHAVEESAA